MVFSCFCPLNQPQRLPVPGATSPLSHAPTVQRGKAASDRKSARSVIRICNSTVYNCQDGTYRLQGHASQRTCLALGMRQGPVVEAHISDVATRGAVGVRPVAA